MLPIALDDRIHADLFCGRLASAIALVAEADAVVEATAARWRCAAPIALANWRGREAEAQALIEASRQDALSRGEGLWLVATDWGDAVRYNGLGRYDDALVAAERAAEDPRGLGTPMWLLADLVEAAARGGKPERARRPARAAGGDRRGQRHRLGAGRPRRARGALLSDGEDAERALPRGGRAPRPHPHPRRARPGRTCCLRRMAAAREPPRRRPRAAARRAHELFAEIGMEAFAERARRELLATGETVRKRTVETLDDLTAAGGADRAARAAEGQTNPEIGAQLFLSPRTVEWHLRKVFGKLGISSRKELRSALPGRARRGGRPVTGPADGGARRAFGGVPPSSASGITATTPCASSMYLSAALSACSGVSRPGGRRSTAPYQCHQSCGGAIGLVGAVVQRGLEQQLRRSARGPCARRGRAAAR